MEWMQTVHGRRQDVRGAGIPRRSARVGFRDETDSERDPGPDSDTHPNSDGDTDSDPDPEVDGGTTTRKGARRTRRGGMKQFLRVGRVRRYVAGDGVQRCFQ